MYLKCIDLYQTICNSQITLKSQLTVFTHRRAKLAALPIDRLLTADMGVVVALAALEFDVTGLLLLLLLLFVLLLLLLLLLLVPR